MEAVFTKIMLLKGYKRIEKVCTGGLVRPFLTKFHPEMVTHGILPPYLCLSQ